MKDSGKDNPPSQVGCGLKEIAGENDKLLGSGTEEPVTYKDIVFGNREYRLFLVAWLLGEAGEWFAYIAGIALIKRILDDPDADEKTAVSILIAVWLFPTVLFSPIGGVLADSRDRRLSMMQLDMIGGVIVLFYLVAAWYESIFMVYLVSFGKQVIAALYEPCGYAILPMVVPDDEQLKKAITLYSFASSLSETIGPFVGGLAVALLGIEACFVIDASIYAASAFLTWLVGGTWDAYDDESSSSDEEDSSGISSEDDDHEKAPSLLDAAGGTWDTEDTGIPTKDESETESESEVTDGVTLLEQYKHMTLDGVRYLSASSFGSLVFLKCSAATIYGALDVLEVSFSELSENEEANDLRLGLLFAFSGLGTVFGTLLTEFSSDMNDPRRLQSSCVWAFLFIALSYLGMGIFPSFVSPCIFTVVDSASATLLWIVSDLLLQKLCESKMLGRVMALDMAMATFSEGASSVLAGVLQDRVGLSAQAVSLVMSGAGIVMFGVWLTYHLHGGGVAQVESTSKQDVAKRSEGHNEMTPLLAANQPS